MTFVTGDLWHRRQAHKRDEMVAIKYSAQSHGGYTMQKTFHWPIAIVVSAVLCMAMPLQASERISIPDGTHHEGTLDTRNNPITIGNGVEIDGNIRSRNGRVSVGNNVVAGDVSTRNGSVTLGQGGHFGQVDTRNGSVTVGSGTQAEAIRTRNGSISVGGDSAIDGELRTRNGSILLERNTRVADDVHTRNGRIVLEPGVEVAGHVGTRNGDISLDQAHVGRNLQSRGGDLTLRDGSHVGGDVVIELTEAQAGRRGGFFGFGGSRIYPEAGDIRILGGSEVHGDVIVKLPANYDERMPRVEIDADSRVHGHLRIDERVELVVDGQVDGQVEHISH